MDATQEPSSSELLALCSGQFESQPEHCSERKRHPSDSGSSQAVRELLGLPVNITDNKPITVGISKLLAVNSRSGMGLNSDETQSTELSEVIELCSGVFPTTQASTLRKRSSITAPTSRQSAGTSDGMSESSESEGENAVLRWAQRQRELGKARNPRPSVGGDLSDSEDEDMPMLAKRKRIRRRPKPTKE